MSRQWIRRLTLTTTAVLAAVVVPGHAQAAPYCGLTWGSQPEARAATAPAGATLDDVRAGRHTCFDRLVIDIDGARVSGYDVRYVSQFSADGSGKPIPLRGAADLQVVVRTPAYDDDGHATYSPRNRSEAVNVSGYSTFRQVAWDGSYEGQSTLGVGTRARLPFRVTVLPGPGSSETRVVIDVAHRW
jgi:hypothetical protein